MHFHDLLAFRVCVEESAVILMYLPSYVICLFSFLFSLFFVLKVKCFNYDMFGSV
jgi:hypothetical protein